MSTSSSATATHLFSGAVNLADQSINFEALANPMVSVFHNQLEERNVFSMPWSRLSTLELEARLGTFVHKPPRPPRPTHQHRGSAPPPPPTLPAPSGPPKRWNSGQAVFRPQPQLLQPGAFRPQMTMPSKALFYIAQQVVQREFETQKGQLRSLLREQKKKQKQQQQQENGEMNDNNEEDNDDNDEIALLFNETSSLTSDIRVPDEEEELAQQQLQMQQFNNNRKPEPRQQNQQNALGKEQKCTRVTIDLRTLQPHTCIDKTKLVALDFGLNLSPVDARLAISSEVQLQHAGAAAAGAKKDGDVDDHDDVNAVNNINNNNLAQQEATKAMAMEQFLMMEQPKYLLSDDDDDEGEGEENDEDENDDGENAVNKPTAAAAAAKSASPLIAPQKHQQQQQRNIKNDELPKKPFSRTVMERRKSRKSFHFDQGITVDITQVMSSNEAAPSSSTVGQQQQQQPEEPLLSLEVELEWDMGRALQCALLKAQLMRDAEAEARAARLIAAVKGENATTTKISDSSAVDDAGNKNNTNTDDAAAQLKQLKRKFIAEGTALLARSTLALAMALRSANAQAAGVRAREG